MGCWDSVVWPHNICCEQEATANDLALENKNYCCRFIGNTKSPCVGYIQLAQFHK